MKAWIVIVACWGIFSGGIVAAQDPASIEISADLKKLDAVTLRMARFLESRASFRVEVSQDWDLKGPDARQGVNRFSLTARHNGPFLLTVGPSPKSEAVLKCFGQEGTITRVLTDRDHQLHSQNPGELEHLLSDALTEVNVRYSGLDILCQEDPHKYLMAMASEVKYVGEEDLPGGKAHHFQMRWGDSQAHLLELWIAAGQSPLLVRKTTRLTFFPAPDRKFMLAIVANLKWETQQDYPDSLFRPEIPENSRRVFDLYCSLSQGGTVELLGKPAPAVDVKLADGGNWDLSKHKNIVLVCFFATWAAPTKEQVSELVGWAGQYKDRGVELYLVDVGDDAQAARAFVRKIGYAGPVVLDRNRKAAAAYRVTALPAVLILGEDGTIQSAHVGSSPEVQAQTEQDLEKLLSGQQLDPPQR